MFAFDPCRWLAEHRPYHAVQLPNVALTLREQSPLTLLAMCCWGEARSEGNFGMLLVGCVVRNRVLLSPRYGRGWVGVLTRPQQFSCFNEGDPNATQMWSPLHYESADVWDSACAAAFDVYEQRCPDLTGGSTHYCTRELRPYWTGAMTPTITYRRHQFWREG